MYEYIGVILVYRIRFNSLLKCVFSEICPVGFQFDSDNKICVGCMLGYYKDVEGNSMNCVSCPVNKTTVSVNSTSVDACSIGKWLYVCHLTLSDGICVICDTKWWYVYHLWHKKNSYKIPLSQIMLFYLSFSDFHSHYQIYSCINHLCYEHPVNNSQW